MGAHHPGRRHHTRMHENMKHLLVLGASGFVGHHLCEALNRANLRVLAPTRRLPARRIQTLPLVDVVQADITHPEVLQDLMQGVDAVINLVAILHGSPEAFERVHVALPRLVAQCAVKAGVKQLVQVSALGIQGTGRESSHYLNSKAQGEAEMTRILYASACALTVLRPSVIFAKDDQFINLLAQLQQVFPFFPLASAQARFQPVWVGDVVSAMLHVLNARPGGALNPLASPELEPVYELAGPEVKTFAELVRLAGEHIGHPRPILPLPSGIARLQAFLMEMMPGQPVMSRDNLDSMLTPNVASARYPGLEALGVLAPKSLLSVFPPSPAQRRD